MIKISKISKSLKLHTEQNLENDFVAVACFIDKLNIPIHAGLIINTKDEGCFLFHYTSESVSLDDLFEFPLVFLNVLNIIDTQFCNLFLGYCTKILDNANPKYGYTYSGSFYDIDGNYVTENKIPEFMTCVGFCINVIKGFIEAEEYYCYSDWTNAKAPLDYIEEFAKQVQKINPDLTFEEISENIRRITPLDFLSGSFIENIPIRKNEVDQLNALVQNAINDKLS